MAELPSLASQDRAPLINYAKRNCWGNPQINQQFQIKLARVSHALGYTKNFVYMGKYYLLPDSSSFFNVFTIGGFQSSFYGIGTRVFNWAPFDRWVCAKEYIEKRGMILDFYNEKGLMYNRSQTWIMQCFNGTTLVAFLKNNITYPMPVSKPMFLRSYIPDVPIDRLNGYEEDQAKLLVSGVIYYDFRDWDNIKAKYQEYTNKNVGRLTVYHNGVIKSFENISPAVGDMVELFLDPTIERVITFKYLNLYNYYSSRDKKNKLIIFPYLNNKERRYYYFDDCEFYVWNTKTNKGIYLHRNNQDCVRQLTHQDYGLAGEYVEAVADYLVDYDTTGRSKLEDIEIIVTYHRTNWKFTLGPTSSRIADLYLLEDPETILNAMTGPKSNVDVWKASNLENSPHNLLLGKEYLDITNENVFDALGYNGCSNVLSNTLFYMPGITPGDKDFEGLYTTPTYLTGKGYLVPPTYRVSSTVYEYDRNGLLLRIRGIAWSEYYVPSKDCVFCEYALGEATSWLDATLTKSDIEVKSDYGFRVYRAPWKIGDNTSEEESDSFWRYEWSISKDGEPLYQTDTVFNLPTQEDLNLPNTSRPWDGGELAGEWEDITDTKYYTFNKDTGYINWNMNMNNYVGMVVSDSKHLYNEITVDHLDHSLSFSLTHMWEIGGVLLPIKPAQLDVWMEGHSLIENVDYIFDFPTIYIVNKQHLVEGKSSYNFKVRATGLSLDGPLKRSELGFVTNGVLGYNGRYNLRINRPTKTVCDGRIYLTQSIDWAENIDHGDNFNGLEGFPYEVKHYVCLNKYVEDYTTQKGIEDDYLLDKEISAYLTEYAEYKSPYPPKVPYQFDRYLVFSPFMSKLYNELRLGFIPTPTENITNQLIDLITKDIQFLLKYDPCVLEFNEAYFEVHPCSDVGYQKITPKQLTILEKVNELYLNSRIKVRGHFEVVDE